MKTLLLTGFEPFLEFPINPTMQIAENLDGKVINQHSIIGRVLPVDFQKAGEQLVKLLEETNPDTVLSLGLAVGRTAITPERIAINCNDGERDNHHYKPKGETIIKDGPDGLFSTLPIQKLKETLNSSGFPSHISNTAGTYLCNHVMYQLLYFYHKKHKQVPAGFIHIPASHQLAIEHGNIPSWSQKDLLDALTLVIHTL